MLRIQQLSKSIITKIAAGEVIERPASVVKELLENSVDAGSTRIDVEVEQGGAERIQIVDDGCGIHQDDLALAFSSHATSKLREADDLFKIGTMGFRGEALASIGGIAQVKVQSRMHNQPSGSEITCHGGELSPVKAWNGAPGTRMSVRHLFYNTPVRRKFLRKTPTELGHVVETFTRVALSHPHLHLSLRHNDKKVHALTAVDDLRERIGAFFGPEVCDSLYPIEAERNKTRLSGFVADPRIERGNSKMQYLFLNGRWIRDRSLGHALQEAYRGLLMTGRYAVAFLFLDMPPDMVDVNVHPTKTEVRFRDGQFLYSMVLATIRDRLRLANLTPKLQAPASSLNQTIAEHTPTQPVESLIPPSPSILPDPPIIPTPSQSNTTAENPPQTLPESIEELDTAFADAAVDHDPVNDSVEPEPSQMAQTDTRAIQLYNAYLVLETPEGMLVIDQHALHERILFEQLKQRIGNGTLESQQLLIPETIDLKPEQAALTLEFQDELGQLGLQIEDFGNGTLLLRSYPAILGNRSPQKMLRAVVDHLCDNDRPPTREQTFNALLSLAACHSAVRAGDPLTQDQIAALVDQRNLTNDSHHCPHGRPTSLLFSRRDLDRQFGRLP